MFGRINWMVRDWLKSYYLFGIENSCGVGVTSVFVDW